MTAACMYNYNVIVYYAHAYPTTIMCGVSDYNFCVRSKVREIRD